MKMNPNLCTHWSHVSWSNRKETCTIPIFMKKKYFYLCLQRLETMFTTKAVQSNQFVRRFSISGAKSFFQQFQQKTLYKSSFRSSGNNSVHFHHEHCKIITISVTNTIYLFQRQSGQVFFPRWPWYRRMSSLVASSWRNIKQSWLHDRKFLHHLE